MQINSDTLTVMPQYDKTQMGNRNFIILKCDLVTVEMVVFARNRFDFHMQSKLVQFKLRYY